MFVKGQLEGKGKIKFYSNQGYYEGELLNSKPHGKGVLCRFGHLYEGTFKHGLLDGYVIHTTPIVKNVYYEEYKEGDLITSSTKRDLIK